MRFLRLEKTASHPLMSAVLQVKTNQFTIGGRVIKMNSTQFILWSSIHLNCSLVSMENLINAHFGYRTFYTHSSSVFVCFYSFSFSLPVFFTLFQSVTTLNLFTYATTSTFFEQTPNAKLNEFSDYFYVESEFPALHLTEFVMRSNVKTKTAKNVEMFQYIDVNDTGGGYNQHNSNQFIPHCCVLTFAF